MTTRMLAMAAALAVLVALQPPTAEGRDLRVRKSVQAMTTKEKREFVAALHELKKSGVYDQFVKTHLELYRCTPGQPEMKTMMLAHSGPMFLPWHREYLLRLENDLRRVSGKDITIPYWDFTDPRSTDAVFAADFMGGNGNAALGHAVDTGPFNQDDWNLTVHPRGLQWEGSATPYITRNFGTASVPTLPTTTDVGFVFGTEKYDAAPYHSSSDPAESFRNALEGFWRTSVDPLQPGGDPRHSAMPGPNGMQCGPDGWLASGPCGCNMHNRVHLWVAGLLGRPARDGEPSGAKVFGTMGVPTSPNDPVFFLNHANIDRLWAEWQEQHPEARHPTEAEAGTPNSESSELTPFTGRTPQHVASVRKLGYRYATQSRTPAQTRSARANRRSLCYLRTERR